jgi:hypothetical protein
MRSRFRPAASESVERFVRRGLAEFRDRLGPINWQFHLDRSATRARDWAKRGDVFLYFISGAKHRNPGRRDGADRAAEVAVAAILAPA